MPHPSAPAIACAPLTLTAQSALTLPVEIHGQSFVFQLDTGASETTITRAHVRLSFGPALMTWSLVTFFGSSLTASAKSPTGG